jgi:hypothetical protein
MQPQAPVQAQPQVQPQVQPMPQVQPQPQPPVYYNPYSRYPVYGYLPRVNAGKVKIDTKVKTDSIYVDGSFIGSTGKNKKFSLTAGNHDIEVRDTTGRSVFKERVQVMVNRTVELKPAS